MLPILLLGFWGPVCAAQTGMMAQQVKAAMLYKFLGYVEWPPETFATPSAPYTIAVAGAPDISNELLQVASSRSVSNRPVIVRNITSTRDLEGVHLLFIGEDTPARIRERLLKRASQQATVAVTESDTDLPRGAIIHFHPVGERIGFDVSLENAHARNLKLSARLLAVATRVYRGAP
jgi:hypothetical protein